MIFPTADEIAVAIVTAARIEGEDPELIALGNRASRGRWYALAALLERFPDNDYRAIALRVGFVTQSTIGNSRATITQYRLGRGVAWWNEANVARVRAALDALADGVDCRLQVAAPVVAPAPEIAATAPLPAPVAPPAAKPALRDTGSLPIRRHAYRRSRVAVEILGDPPVGRSALDQRGDAS